MIELTQPLSSSNQIRKTFSVISELGKFKITFFVSVTTSFGYLLDSGDINYKMVLIAFAVFLMASGASAINQVQEKDSDKNMNRTKIRPIPSGEIGSVFAFSLGLFLILVGSLFLLYWGGFIPFVLGLITFVWYNFIYTPLKKYSAFAIIPGSVVGALPPVIGWTASGGNLFDNTAIGLALFFFIWQVPHFWLLLMIYDKEYKSVGFPVLTDVFNKYQLSRISYAWIFGLGISSLSLVIYDSNINYLMISIMVLMIIILLYFSSSLLSKNLGIKTFRKNFYYINIYVLLIIAILSFEKLIK
ncbi:MAG: hypothetical protein CO129_00460 [Ignavibacteriales bacterium CG_4_9_14_3_um_filter_34_10]|nr:MAG: hypothetical protein CO129_00460 [Ignavibacteriales bacterium CG_4_9_14_3_um_filter_34_10]